METRTDKGERILRHYFLDVALCLDPTADREDAVVSVPETFKITSQFGRKTDLDLSTPALQFARRMVPVRLLFDAAGYMGWKMAYTKHYANDPEQALFLMRFDQEVWLRFQEFKVPAIEMSGDTPREAVCQVFEKVNTGGVTLTVFELMTATFAASEFNLRDDWEAREARLRDNHPVLEAVDGTAFLTAVTLLASFVRHNAEQSAISCKRADVLRLPLEAFLKQANCVEAGFRRAAELLAEWFVFDLRGLPYATQLIPFAAICSALGSKVDHFPTKQKLARWYWCGVFGELYGGANETRYALDLPNVVQWVVGGGEPRTIRDASFAPIRLLSLQTRLAAAYKGLAALLMRQGSRDFVDGAPVDLHTYFNRAVDVHHVFPRAWCEAQHLKRERWNSIVNKAPLSAATNRYLGGQAPSMYLSRIETDRQVDAATLDGFLQSHAIPVPELRADAFEAFLQTRAACLLSLIEEATGKSVAGRDSDETVAAFGAALG